MHFFLGEPPSGFLLKVLRFDVLVMISTTRVGQNITTQFVLLLENMSLL